MGGARAWSDGIHIGSNELTSRVYGSGTRFKTFEFNSQYGIPYYGINEFVPVLRLYTVAAGGGRLNGESGIPVRVMTSLPSRTGAAVVNGTAVILYTLNGYSYYGPWYDKNW